MKTVILAGGFGTRIGEETNLRPKPMIEVGGKPLLWHILKIYSSQGFNDFIICLGYKGYIIKEYFANFALHQSDLTIDLSNDGAIEYHSHSQERWRVTLVETGLNTMTGSRLSKVRSHIGDERFMFTYGDGVADINIPKLIEFHSANNKIGTVTAVKPPARFGALSLNQDSAVTAFREKIIGDEGWINAGFFIFEPKLFDYLDSDREDQIFEREPLENLARDNQLMAFQHTGFWQPVDTQRERQQLDNLWNSNQAPWKIW